MTIFLEKREFLEIGTFEVIYFLFITIYLFYAKQTFKFVYCSSFSINFNQLLRVS